MEGDADHGPGPIGAALIFVTATIFVLAVIHLLGV